jgi:5-(carboxyamino)imidazole ribonucleotide synthase
VGEVIQGEFDDPEALDIFAHGLALATYEFENVPVIAVERLEKALPVSPPAPALAMTQDRLVEKEGFRRLGILTAPFHSISSLDELKGGIDSLGLPAILKTRRLGYDGKGQVVIRAAEEVESAWTMMGENGSLILESFIPFRRELSILSVRGRNGETAHYPVTENEHRGGILRSSRAPIPGFSEGLEEEARRIATLVLDELGYVGVLAIELFETQEGHLLANEMAPRVHNSGHWTQNGAVTSQFENHIRAITGLPLGSTEPTGWSAMLNLLGSWPDPEQVLRLPGTFLHLYGKEPRPLRKVGHVNVRAADLQELELRRAAVEGLIAN